MNNVLTINNSNQKKSVGYISFLVIFWIIWTPITLFALFAALENFHWFFALWLPFGLIGVFGIPWSLLESKKDQILKSNNEELIIIGTGNPFMNTVKIPRSQKISVHLGNYESDSDGSESVVTLNIFTEVRWVRRIMISPISHYLEKRKLFHEIVDFLKIHKHDVYIMDEHPKSRAEQDDEGNWI